ncbi:hypothetical protein DEU35_2605 [Microbacterium sp. AG157]|uniref:hypothetical protein n=1 Tax=Microbacterium sp. AG157 TaxID=2183993 RepID=UPI000E396675|nr:hypothetical protein [Microbacterium sp. AG157]REC98104.1 hypothetical protein DEU35_2605 [Microbacterium sp. AG157]
MRRTPTKVLGLALVTAALVLLSACAPTNDPGVASATPTAIASQTPTGASAASSPEECDGVDLIADAKVTGEALSACVIAFSRAAGSGHLHLQSADLTGEADFIFGDAPATSGSITGSDGTHDFVLTPTESWVSFDGTWVRANATSSDYRAVIVSTIGQTYRAFADPTASAALLAAAPGWTVQPDQDAVSLPDGTEVRAWRVRADGPFSASGVEVKDMTVWLGAGHRVVAIQQTGAFGGIETTTMQQFTAWGEPVKIEVPKG